MVKLYRLKCIFSFLLLSLFAVPSPAIGQEAAIQLTAEEKSWLAAHPEIILGFNPEIEPLLVVSEGGDLSGILVDIYDELEA